MKYDFINQIMLKRNVTRESIIICSILLVAIFIVFIPITSNILGCIVYSIAMIPLAIVLGRSTSKISESIGEKRGGLVAATAGNVPELMMGFWSIKYGMISMAKAGLLGVIITNMLLAIGISVFLGGIKYREQRFNKVLARTNFNMLFLLMCTIIIIAALDRYSVVGAMQIDKISSIVCFVLIGVYILGLIFSLYTHSSLFVVKEEGEVRGEYNSSTIRRLFLLIIIITIVLYFISEKLIENINIVTLQYNISEEFLGIILIPLLGSFGENAASIVCAINNQIDASLETAIGSSIQISMFVIPLLIIFSFSMGIEINLLFSTFQIIMLAISIGMSYFVFQDGKTYWFEGGLLIATYIVITMAYYYIT